jgi:hypothetical protein
MQMLNKNFLKDRRDFLPEQKKREPINKSQP